jgi:ferredoxin-NADP reductase
MLRYIAEERLPYRITLFFSNRNRAETAFFEELHELEREIDGLTVVFTMTEDPEWEGETRRLDPDVLREYLGERFDDVTFLVAGPPTMAKGVQESLLASGVDEERVLTDSFSGY